MRKLFLILLLSYLSASLSAQLSGTGTWTDPYSGTFQNDLQWNFANFPGGKIYIGGDITIDDELLTIEAGISVIFITEGADLIVNGTGRINASGTLNYQIIFTADDDNDSNYGESGERWGHIVFNNPSSTNQSKFEYCIIEYGDVGSGSNTTSYGGAIYSNTYSNFVLNNCTLRNNRASHGGAILLYTGASPSISNCLITENIATTTGGAIYSQAQSGLNLINCVISFNTAVASSGGGIFIDGSDNSRFINCNIVNNNSASGGRNIHFYAVSSSTVKPMFINSIAWGSDNSIEYSGFSIRTETDFVNCAIQDIATPASYFTDCIDLNSSNSATDGPNFNATDGSDWSIKFISPCRDTGTDSYSGVTIPTTDFEGNPRIQTTDIGAYECQYSSWTGATSTSWTTASNWEADIDPSTGTGDVVIPSGLSTYPVSASNPDFTIGSDNVMILEPGTRATLNNFTNNGSLTMQANASGLSSLIMASYSKGGTATENIQLYLTGGYIGDPEYNEGRWHYIATPVSNFSKNIFTANTNDLAQWVDGMQSAGSLRDGYVAHDGYVYYSSDPGDPSTWTGPTFNTFTLGKGYNFWDNLASYTYSVSGQLNTGSVNASLAFAGEEYENGFNLLGNPFTSGLDWDYIVENTVFPDNTSKGIFFTKDNIQYSYVSGVLVPDHGLPAPSGVIPPMQGFFVKTYSTGNSINLTSAARTHDDIPARYKGLSPIPLVRLGLTDNTATDETVVRFAEKALAGIDMDYDAPKMYNPGKSSIFTIIPGKKMAINGLPFLEPETFIEIPLSVNIKSAGNHTINAIQIQEIADYDVFLTDNTTGYTTDLKTSPELTFSSSTGLIEGRFILKISNVTTGIEDPSSSPKPFSIYQSSEFINIRTLSDAWDGKSGEVKVYNLSGKTISENRNAEFFMDSMIRIPAPASKGLYIVELKSGPLKHVGKVVIN